MEHRSLIASLLLAVAALAGVLVIAPGEWATRRVVHVPAPPQDPWTARDQWVQLRGGEPARMTPMAPPTRRVPIVNRLLARTPHGADRQVHRDRPPGFVPAAIVLHATGSGEPGVDVHSLDALRAFFARAGGPASAHYAIDRRGRVMRMVADDDAAFHVARPGWNDVSIGIELLNDNSGTEPFPVPQLESLTQLVRALGRRHGIPVEGVVRHRAIQPEDRSDPANNFPWRRWIATLH